EFLLRITAVVGGDLGHDAIRVARNALQGYAEHAMHVTVGLGGFKETDAAFVGVAHRPREGLLAKVALDLAADPAGAKCKSCDLDVGPAECDPVGRSLAGAGRERESARKGDSACGGAGFEEFAAGVERHKHLNARTPGY